MKKTIKFFKKWWWAILIAIMAIAGTIIAFLYNADDKTILSIKLAWALIIVVGAYTVIGSTNAYLDNTFDVEIFKKGIIKGFIIAISLFALYVVGILITNNVQVFYNGQAVNIDDIVLVIIKAAIGLFVIKIIAQITSMIGINIKVTNTDQTEEKVIEEGE
jgi:small basic protein